ncbi:diacylglycerol/lipid kinase family protein [Legionella spiritensis]|uniref:diacylglycerol/lipid kinase family protein n=1 Tax=Legionella spiritensis TaxID=452 RepID=UPI000F6F2FE8|nr:diacylglycerol kinase family protein [Legionella spiritensis]VEG90770.1 transcriptional regulator [Legionella spiritensis]
MSHIAVVINPVAGNGFGKRAWQILQPGLHAMFQKISSRMSNHADDIGIMTRDLLSAKPDYLLIVGGDGTLSQVVNSLFQDEKQLSPETRLAFFNCGCGGDFVRQFPAQKITEFLDRLAHNQYITTNIGQIRFGDQRVKYFVNIASVGMSAQVVVNASKGGWLKKLGGSVFYFIHGLSALLRYKPGKVRIRCDNHPVETSDVWLIALCNGQYFGGNMHIAPLARIDDDMLDVVTVLNFNRIKVMFKFIKIYTGRHLLEKQVHYMQAREVTLDTDQTDIPVEADGEFLGYLPAAFTLIPGYLKLIV